MNLVRRHFLNVAAASIGYVATSHVVWAQSYPARPVRVIVPFAPGGATDIVARPIVQELSRRLGQQFYVENVAGASGNIGTGQAAKALPDGHTILFAFSSHVTNPSMFDKVPYDPIKDFRPITLAVTSPSVVCVHPSVPAKTIAELVAIIRSNPGKYSYASGGTGTQPQLAAEQFRVSLGLDLVHVPFNGGGPALVSTIGGHTPISFTTLTPAVPQIKEGTLRALAVIGKRRSQTVPDVPTMAEAGYPGIEGDTWVGVLAPAGTESHVVAVLQREMAAVLKEPTMSGRLVALGYEPVASTPDEYAALISTEVGKWAQVIRSAGVRVR